MPQRSPLVALAPALCALHCLATPVLVATVPAFVVHPAVEWGAFALSALAARMTLRRRGGRLRRGTTGASLAGFVLWLVALTIVHDGPAHTPVLVAGSLTVAAALAAELWLAHRERHDCECHVCASGADEITPAERAALG